MSKDYFPKVESYLFKYKRWKSRLTVIELELGMLMPSLTPVYSDMPMSATNVTSDSTARVVIDRSELEKEYRQILNKVAKLEVALLALTDEQKELFDLRYVREEGYLEAKDTLNVGKDKYYQIRDEVVETVHEIIKDSIY